MITADFVDRFSLRQSISDESRVRLAKYIWFAIDVAVGGVGTFIG